MFEEDKFPDEDGLAIFAKSKPELKGISSKKVLKEKKKKKEKEKEKEKKGKEKSIAQGNGEAVAIKQK